MRGRGSSRMPSCRTLFTTIVLVIVARLSGSAVGKGAQTHANAPAVGASDKELLQWVESEGGKLNVHIGYNDKGIRGLFTSVDAEAGDVLATIPSSCVLNAGPAATNLGTSVMLVLRELKDPHSRLKPYIQSWPPPGSTWNVCNLPKEYWSLLESEYWEDYIARVQAFLEGIIAGSVNKELELTIKEAVGNANVTLEDLKYACVAGTTRYVGGSTRDRLFMVPIFDLMNHERGCPTYFTGLELEDQTQIRAAASLKAGDELCYEYGSDVRDDYGVMTYGFLQPMADPPLLLKVDHRDFNVDDPHQALTIEPFTGTAEEMQAEVARLQGILDHLHANDQVREPGPKPGSDPIYDMLHGLQQRRRHVLKYEIQRLQGELSKEAAGAAKEL